MPKDLVFHVKSKRRIKISHLYLSAFILLTSSVRIYPFSAGGKVFKEFSSFLFLIKHTPDRRL